MTGGGFSFPRTSSYALEGMYNNGDGSWALYTSPPAEGDPNVKTNVRCMTVP